MCPMITRFGCFFLRKCRCSELNCLLSEVLVTLPEEQRLSSDLLHPLDCFSTSQTSQIPNKIITAQVEICNPRINYDIDIKHGPVIKPDKRYRTRSKIWRWRHVRKLWRHCHFSDLWLLWSNSEAVFRKNGMQNLHFH